MKKRKKPDIDPVEKELNNIKRLLVLLLLKIGTDQTEIALALQVDESTVSKWIPARKIEPLKIMQ
jgi:DNA-binding NarL/FixJ family response regulator